jgi:hypothetical protein
MPGTLSLYVINSDLLNFYYMSRANFKKTEKINSMCERVQGPEGEKHMQGHN